MRLSCALQAHHSPQIFTVHQCGSCWNPELWVLRRHHYISMIDKNHWPFTPSSANLAFPKVEEWGQKFQPLITWLASQAVSPYLQVIFFCSLLFGNTKGLGSLPSSGNKDQIYISFYKSCFNEAISSLELLVWKVFSPETTLHTERIISQVCKLSA